MRSRHLDLEKSVSAPDPQVQEPSSYCFLNRPRHGSAPRWSKASAHPNREQDERRPLELPTACSATWPGLTWNRRFLYRFRLARRSAPR